MNGKLLYDKTLLHLQPDIVAPIKLMFSKESVNLIALEVKQIENQVEILKPTIVPAYDKVYSTIYFNILYD